MRRLIVIGLLGIVFAACNPFAPALDTEVGTGESILGDQTTIEGVFQNMKYAYTFRDTTIYGQLLNYDFVFVYRDYDRGVDISWGRDEEMRTANGLFRNVQRLDLVWNNITSLTVDSSGTVSDVTRNFNLTVTFNPSDIIRVEGYADLALARPVATAPWMVVRWRDVSNF